MQSWKGVSIKTIVSEPEWQKLRKSFLGTWKKEPEENVKKLRKYLKSNGNDDLAWVRVYNYLTGSAFRIGVISHPTITKLSKEVKEYINTIRNKK
jgi:hypothetical protein